MQRTSAELAAIRQLDRTRCHICGLDIRMNERAHLDHVIPLARGGTDTPDNMAWAHAFCNLSKGNRLKLDRYDIWWAQRKVKLGRGEDVPMCTISELKRLFSRAGIEDLAQKRETGRQDDAG